MAIVYGLVSLQEVKAALGISPTDTASDAELEGVIEATSRLIERHCGRIFRSVAEVRRFTATDNYEVQIDDLHEVIWVKTDDDGDGVAEETWAATDYEALPSNRAVVSAGELQPWTRLVVPSWGTRVFPAGLLKGVAINGRWGFVQNDYTTPEPVRQAALIQAQLIFRSKDAPFGVVATGVDGNVIRMSSRLHPEAALLLDAYRRRTGLAY
jgi:hypothetical protein